MPLNDSNTKLLLQARGDQSISEAEATIHGSPQVVSFNAQDIGGVVNHSAFFDGGDARLDIPYSPEFEFASEFTIEAYVLIDEYASSEQHIVSGRYILGTYRGWSLYVDPSGFTRFDFGDTTIVAADSMAIPLGKWTHIAVVRDAYFNVKLYLDGKEQGSATSAVNFTATNGLAIGNDLACGDLPTQNPFKGYMAMVAINRTQVYSSEFTRPKTIDALTNISSTSLFLDFTDMTQGSGATPVDTSPSPKTLTRTATKGCTFWWGPAYSFIGATGTYIDLGTLSSLDLTNKAYTISFWFFCHNVPDNYIFSLTGDEQYDFSYWPYSSKEVGYSILLTRLIQTNRWYHCEITSSPSTDRHLNLDGIEYSNGNDWAIGPGDLLIGANRDRNKFYSGMITDFKIDLVLGHTSNFTSPTAPSLKNADTRVLLQPTGDSSDEGETITLKGPLVISQESSPGFGQSFKLDGLTSCIEAPSGGFSLGQ